MNANDLFENVYRAHSRQIHAYLLARTNDRETTADLLQDVFARIWNRMEMLGRIPAEQRLYWLFSIAGNRLKDHYRKNETRLRSELRLRREPIRAADGNDDPARITENRETFRELEAAIRQLPEDERVLLHLSMIGEMNSTDIGSALGMPAGTVRWKLAQARKKLAAAIGLLRTEAGTAQGGKRRERQT